MSRPLKTTPGCPHVDWEWLGARDLHEEDGVEFGDYQDCEFCWKEQIRYVHSLRHSDWPNIITVGRICANNLSSDPNVDLTERRLRNRSQRRTKFVDLKSWRVSAKGNEWIRYLGHHIILVPWSNKKYRLRIDGELGKLDFETSKNAKRRAFDVVMHILDKSNAG